MKKFIIQNLKVNPKKNKSDSYFVCFAFLFFTLESFKIQWKLFIYFINYLKKIISKNIIIKVSKNHKRFRNEI